MQKSIHIIFGFVVFYFFSVALLMGQDGYNNNTEEIDLSSAILGKWENTDSILHNYYFIFEFFENGHGIQIIKNLTNDELPIERTYTFTYIIKDNKIEFYLDQEQYSGSIKFTIINNILTLKEVFYIRNDNILRYDLVLVKID